METPKETASCSSTEIRGCIVCAAPIPEARLKALPTATKCIPCLLKEGDVLKLKRHDDHFGNEGEIVEIYFKKPSHYVERTMQRLNGAAFAQYGQTEQYN